MESTTNKFNLNDLLSKLRDIDNKDAFTLYVKSMWQDLKNRSDSQERGIDKLTFLSYYQLPGIISHRLFSVFDVNQDNYLTLNEFYHGMLVLFVKCFNDSCKLVFDLYDADKDGYISKDDIKSVLQYITLETDENMAYSNLSINVKIKLSDRIESQEEIKHKLNILFAKNEYLTYEDYEFLIEEKNSDIYLLPLIFILENKPFSKQTIDSFKFIPEKKHRSPEPPSSNNLEKLIASPSQKSKFSPQIYLLNKDEVQNTPSPQKKKKVNLMEKKGVNLMNKYAGKMQEAEIMLDDSSNFSITNPQISLKPMVNYKAKKTFELLKDNEKIEMIEKKFQKMEINEIKEIKESMNASDSEEEIYTKDYKISPSIKDNQIHEGYMYKLHNEKGVKKMWFKLIGKDLFCKH